MNNTTSISGGGKPCHLWKKVAFGPERAWIPPTPHLPLVPWWMKPSRALPLCGAGNRERAPLDIPRHTLSAAFNPRLYTHVYFTRSITQMAALPAPFLLREVGVG